MPDRISPEVALTIFRALAGVKDYPFHVEGEERRAGVLVECCDGVSHARQVIEEFDSTENCPTVDALRAAARRLGELCECGKAKWAHRDGAGCRRFNGAPAEDEGWTKTAAGFTKFRQSVPMIPGVPWEVALQVEAIRIQLGQRGTPTDMGGLEVSRRKYPEAVAAIYAGQDPDCALIERQMRALHPWAYKSVRVSRGELRTAVDRIAEIDK